MPRLVADLAPLRRHRTFRLLWFGQAISAMGGQLTVVGVSFQAYTLSHSTLVVGLVSLVQLVPVLVGSIGGGPVVDAKDRRTVLVVAQVSMAFCSAALVANALLSHQQLWVLFVATSLSALFQGANYSARRAAITMAVPPEDITAASALQAMLILAVVVGPPVAGVLIGFAGLKTVYAIDVATFVVSTALSLRLPSMAPTEGGTRMNVQSVVEGLGYLRRQRLLASTFWIDLDAMVFGMPRAVFPALATGLYHGGAQLLGLLYAAPGAGGLVASVLSGWTSRVARQGRAVVVAVCLWGASIAAFGVVRAAWAGLLLLAVAGGADTISMVFRQAISQATAPEHLQGRLAGVYFAVVYGGPRLGDAETGAVAVAAGPQVAVWSGGLACLAGVAVVLWRVPELWRERTAEPLRSEVVAEGVADAAAQLGEAEPP